MEKSVKTILFICTGNTCRSPMEAALFNHYNQDPARIAASAGLAAIDGEPASPPAMTVLRDDFGIDLSRHRARQVTREMLESAEWVLTQDPRQKEMLRRRFPELAGRILTVGELAGEPDLSINDPFGGDMRRYRNEAARMASLILKILEKLSKQP